MAENFPSSFGKREDKTPYFPSLDINKAQGNEICDFTELKICQQLQQEFQGTNESFHFFALIEIKENGRFDCNLVIPAPREVHLLDKNTLVGRAIPKNHPGTAVIKIDGKIVRQEITAENSMVGAHKPGIFGRETLGIVWNDSLSGEFRMHLEKAILDSAQLRWVTANSTLFLGVNTKAGFVDCRVSEGKVGQKIDEKAKGQDSPDTKVVNLQTSQPQPENFASVGSPDISLQSLGLPVALILTVGIGIYQNIKNKK